MAYADITMFGDVAQRFLKVMGYNGAAPGVIVAENIPAALTALKAALAEAPPQDTKKDQWDEPVVSLTHRALPLIELLTAAEKEGCNVMWDVS